MPNEFSALHKTETIVTTFIGKAKSKLIQWERELRGKIDKFDPKSASLKNAKSMLKIFEETESSFASMEKEAQTDPEVKQNYGVTLKLLKGLWEGNFTKYLAQIKPLATYTPKKFNNASEFSLAIKNAKTKIDSELLIENSEKILGKKTDSKTMRIKIKDYAFLSNNLSLQDGEESDLLYTLYNLNDEFVTSADSYNELLDYIYEKKIKAGVVEVYDVTWDEIIDEHSLEEFLKLYK